MFSHLQSKWNVTPLRLIFIFITFAVGGSLTGLAGKKIMSAFEIEAVALYILIYIILVTLLWPLAVLTVSIPFGQFLFFKSYLHNLFARLANAKGATDQTNNKKANALESKQAALLPGTTQTNLKRLAIFASGAGSNAAEIIHYFKGSNLVTVGLVVCNKPGAGVVSLAAAKKIPLLLIEKEAFFSGGYVAQLKEAQITLIVLAGFLWKIPQPLIAAFSKRIINIHPALLPKYGGKGMYGQYVHQAVIENGEKESGITIHYVDEHYDNGDIIFQQRCPVLPTDTPETLAQRVHALEHAHFAPVINKVLQNL